MRQLADDESGGLPKGATVLREDVYVGDVLTGISTIAEALDIRLQLEQICNSGGFPLKKWAANEDVLLGGIPREHRSIRETHAWLQRECHSTLELEWRSREDSFSFVLRPFKKSAITKRGILSQAAQLFDPLG